MTIDAKEARRLAQELIRAADEADDHLSMMSVMELNLWVKPSEELVHKYLQEFLDYEDREIAKAIINAEEQTGE